jgi:hypothetical protein
MSLKLKHQINESEMINFIDEVGGCVLDFEVGSTNPIMAQRYDYEMLWLQCIEIKTPLLFSHSKVQWMTLNFLLLKFILRLKGKSQAFQNQLAKKFLVLFVVLKQVTKQNLKINLAKIRETENSVYGYLNLVYPNNLLKINIF